MKARPQCDFLSARVDGIRKPRGTTSATRGDGFTLVELLVALALAAMISVSIMFISTQARMAYDGMVKNVDVYTRFRFAFHSIVRDIERWEPTSELEFYTDGRGRGARVNRHWDPGEEIPDRKDEWGLGVVDGGLVGQYDEYPQILQLQYRSREPDQSGMKLHDCYQMYFRTLTYIDGAMRCANVEYMLVDPSKVDPSKVASTIPPVPKDVEAAHVQDLALYKIVRYYHVNPKDALTNPNITPINRRVVEVCSNITDFRVEYLVEKDARGRVEPGFRTPEAEFKNCAEKQVIPTFEPRLGVNGGYRKTFGYGSVKLAVKYPLAIVEPGIRSDEGLVATQMPRPVRFGFRGNPDIYFGELIPGDTIFIFTAAERGEIGGGAVASAGNVSQLTRFPTGDYTVKTNYQGLLEFDEDIDTTEWGTRTQSGIYYKASFLPAAVRLTIRAVDDQGQNPKTLQRTVWLRRRSR